MSAAPPHPLFHRPCEFMAGASTLESLPPITHAEVALIGRNLTNRVIVNGGHDLVGTGSGTGTAVGVPAAQVGLVGLPRTIQAQISFRY